jgi:hypothetical protein
VINDETCSLKYQAIDESQFKTTLDQNFMEDDGLKGRNKSIFNGMSYETEENYNLKEGESVFIPQLNLDKNSNK